MKEPYFELYRDKKAGWRWRVRAKNGKVVADCAESYKTRRAAMRGIELVVGCLTVLDEDGTPV